MVAWRGNLKCVLEAIVARCGAVWESRVVLLEAMIVQVAQLYGRLVLCCGALYGCMTVRLVGDWWWLTNYFS